MQRNASLTPSPVVTTTMVLLMYNTYVVSLLRVRQHTWPSTSYFSNTRAVRSHPRSGCVIATAHGRPSGFTRAMAYGPGCRRSRDGAHLPRDQQASAQRPRESSPGTTPAWLIPPHPVAVRQLAPSFSLSRFWRPAPLGGAVDHRNQQLTVAVISILVTCYCRKPTGHPQTAK